MKGSVLSISFVEFITRMKTMIANGDFRQAIPESEIDDEGEKILDCLELFLKSEYDNNEENEESLAQLFSKEEIPHLLDTLTFSLYTYLEAYSLEIVNRLEKSRNISKQIVERLQQWYNQHPDKEYLKFVEKITNKSFHLCQDG